MFAEGNLSREFREQSNRIPLDPPLSGFLRGISYLHEDLGDEDKAS